MHYKLVVVTIVVIVYLSAQKEIPFNCIALSHALTVVSSSSLNYVMSYDLPEKQLEQER
jgi:hypothetical protein